MALLNLTTNQKLIIFNYVQCNYNQKSPKKCCDDAEGCAKQAQGSRSVFKVSGPVQPLFWHYSKLGGDRYHCHLALNWVACWTCKNGSIDIEVYYAGSREKAPY